MENVQAIKQRFELIGNDVKLNRAIEKAIQVAPTDISVLVTGESGVGKELVASAIHEASDRKRAPFICLNCAALSETLLESELFGHEKGAFTGATDRKTGKFESAHKGTLFLDEIGDMPLPLQAKLLRAIENKTILEIGPGTGNLTSYILKKNPKKIFVIEKDDNLALNLKNKFDNKIIIINDDILKLDETILFQDKVIVFGNLPYNISTEILSKWIINLNEGFWFECLILMFQKEVADRIIAKFNTSNYGRLSVLSNWKLNIKKVCDIKPGSFYPKPKVDSSLLFFHPKKNFIKLNNPKNLEKVTRIFFNQRRKMLKKPYNQLFNGDQKVSDKLNINLNLRPQNLNLETYYKLAYEYENSRS